MEDLICFTAVEFVDDPNVVGYHFWYLCGLDGAAEGDEVVCPLGRHNREQTGIIRKVLYETEERAPFPLHLIKRVRRFANKKEGKSI